MVNLAGVNVAAITARQAGGRQLDFGASLEILDFLNAAGVNAIAVHGTTGEFLHFDFEERNRLVSEAVKRSRAPIVANVSHSTLEGSLALAEAAHAAGAAALLLMPPYFFPYTQPQLERFFLEFAARAPDGADILLYNIPFFTTPLECGTSLSLLSSGRFAGIKDSSGSYEAFLRFIELRQRLPLTLLVGNDVVFTRARTAGAHGVVSGVACAFPELMLGLDRAILAGDAAARDTLENRLQEFIGWLERFPTPIGVREAVATRGLKIGPHSIPLDEATLRALGEFREWLSGWWPQVRKEAQGV